MIHVLGLDLSLTATGYAGPDGVGVLKVKTSGIQRLAELRDAVMELAITADVTVLEGYAYAKGNQAHQVGELGGVVRLGLWMAEIPYAVVPPKTLKKFATDNGNAGKDAMLATAIRRFGFEGESNDEADAWLLREMGLRHYDRGGPLMPGYQLRALDTVLWPRLDSEQGEEVNTGKEGGAGTDRVGTDRAADLQAS